jgi:hypothetical protein
MALYCTSDTAEAAYLISNGIKLLSTDNNQFPVEFTLEGQTDELLLRWETFDCPEKKFYKIYRYLLQKIKGVKNGS